jgi:hypothetical protein
MLLAGKKLNPLLCFPFCLISEPSCKLLSRSGAGADQLPSIALDPARPLLLPQVAAMATEVMVFVPMGSAARRYEIKSSSLLSILPDFWTLMQTNIPQYGWCGSTPAHCSGPSPTPPTSGGSRGYVTYHNYLAGQKLTDVACSDGRNGLETRWGYSTIDPMVWILPAKHFNLSQTETQAIIPLTNSDFRLGSVCGCDLH